MAEITAGDIEDPLRRGQTIAVELLGATRVFVEIVRAVGVSDVTEAAEARVQILEKHLRSYINSIRFLARASATATEVTLRLKVDAVEGLPAEVPLPQGLVTVLLETGPGWFDVLAEQVEDMMNCAAEIGLLFESETEALPSSVQQALDSTLRAGNKAGESLAFLCSADRNPERSHPVQAWTAAFERGRRDLAPGHIGFEL